MLRTPRALLHQAIRLGLVALAGAAQAQQYDVRTYGLEHGLPSASVHALREDKAGFLWIATDGGAVRTDGLHFTTFGLRDGLPTEGVTALCAMPGGGMWLGLPNGDLARVESGGIAVLQAPINARHVVSSIATDLQGTVYAATTGGQVIVHAGNGISVMDQGQGLPGSAVRVLVWSGQSRLLAGTDQGLYELRQGHWHALAVNSELPGPQVFALHADSLGVLVGTSHGYLELDRDLAPLPPAERFMGAFPIALPDARVLSVMRSRAGDIWLGTPAGMHQLTRRGGQPLLRIIGEANGLGHGLVRCVLQDRSGAVWAGTGFGGISKVVSAAFLHFTERDGLGSRIVSAIRRTPDGLLWMSTLGGGVARWDGTALRVFSMAEGLTDPYVTCLAEDQQGHLIAGTASHGIFRLEVDRFKPMGHLATDAGIIRTIAVDDEDGLWAGSAKGVFHRAAGQPWQKIGPLGPMVVHALLPVPEGILAATDDGLQRVDRAAGTIHPHALPGVKATSIARDSRGNLWVGSEGAGLWRVSADTAIGIGMDQGLPSPSVEQVLLDAYENLWVGTRQGFAYIELDELQERVLRVTTHGRPDGFLCPEAFRNACMLDGDSTLWFGTVRGATRHDPRQRLVEAREPSVHITDLRLFFERPDWSPWCKGFDPDGLPVDLELPHDRNHLTFAFTGISLAYPEQVRYRYILEGHDPDWSPITATDRVTYSNLPPGDYVFQVEARNTRGWTPDPVRFAFRITPPLWATTPFKAGTAAALLLLLAGIVRLRERRLRRDRERLETIVAVRTRELATEKDRSERLLRNILPASTAEELKTRGTAEARRHEQVTVLFADFAGFTGHSQEMDSRDLVADLDLFFRRFDRLCDKHGVEKIKTIGDAYMCASGVPDPCADHALRAVRLAMDMIDSAGEVNAERRTKGLPEWTLRVGIHSGPVVAGVVGEKKFAYDIWGDTVNLASRMESNGAPGRVNISGATYALVMDHIEAVPRGPVKVKGKGQVQMYYVERERSAHVEPGPRA
ncbi:MAG: hypothetical protein KIT10_14060 [Flavobacteriales bacterium]|nr:hypothetical protein [Flavobacteriales bacterium]